MEIHRLGKTGGSTVGEVGRSAGVCKQVQVELSHYRPGGLQQVEAPRISKQSAPEGGKTVSTTHRLLSFPPGDIHGTVSVKG